MGVIEKSFYTVNESIANENVKANTSHSKQSSTKEIAPDSERSNVNQQSIPYKNRALSEEPEIANITKKNKCDISEKKNLSEKNALQNIDDFCPDYEESLENCFLEDVADNLQKPNHKILEHCSDDSDGFDKENPLVAKYDDAHLDMASLYIQSGINNHKMTECSKEYNFNKIKNEATSQTYGTSISMDNNSFDCRGRRSPEGIEDTTQLSNFNCVSQQNVSLKLGEKKKKRKKNAHSSEKRHPNNQTKRDPSLPDYNESQSESYERI